MRRAIRVPAARTQDHSMNGADKPWGRHVAGPIWLSVTAAPPLRQAALRGDRCALRLHLGTCQELLSHLLAREEAPIQLAEPVVVPGRLGTPLQQCVVQVHHVLAVGRRPRCLLGTGQKLAAYGIDGRLHRGRRCGIALRGPELPGPIGVTRRFGQAPE